MERMEANLNERVVGKRIFHWPVVLVLPTNIRRYQALISGSVLVLLENRSYWPSYCFEVRVAIIRTFGWHKDFRGWRK